MHSPTSLEGSQLVRIVKLCAQTRLPGPRGHRDAFLSSSKQCKAPRVSTRQATEPRAKREARSVLCHSLVVDSTFEQSENVTITR